MENYTEGKNDEAIRLQLDLVDEVRAIAKQRLAWYQNLMAKHYNSNVRHRDFQVRDLVLREVMSVTKDPLQGKGTYHFDKSTKWTDPMRVKNFDKSIKWTNSTRVKYFDKSTKWTNPTRVKYLTSPQSGRTLQGLNILKSPQKWTNLTRVKYLTSPQSGRTL